MTDKEKQIDEIKNELLAFTPMINMPFECFDEVAKAIYKAGYRKQSDTVREILQKLIYNITANNTNDGYLSESIDYSSTIDDIKELAAQYGVEVEE